MKRFLICLLAVLTVAALVACGGTKNEPAETPTDAPVVTEAPEATAEPAATEAPEATAEPVVTEEPTAEPVEPTESPDDGEAAEILGEWNLTKAVVSGVEVTAEQIGQSMSFTFNADGSAAMTANGQTQQGLSWSYADGIVTLSALGRDLYDLTYDGTALTLHEPNSGADLVFER